MSIANRVHTGSVAAFDANWRNRPESQRYHFIRGNPRNQIQFAFQNHWRVFRKVLQDVQGGRVLEAGSGRGSMGAFFADAGFEVDLLDTSSAALEIAEANFSADGLSCNSVCGDALDLPYDDESFDVVVSIGLLEHFEDIDLALTEQLRVLRPGGVLLGYVVPERRVSVQTLAVPINFCLKTVHGLVARKTGKQVAAKSPLYRNDYHPNQYLEVMRRQQVEQCGSFGMFPFPLVSHSPTFPFSLMARPLERALVGWWKTISAIAPVKDPWICPHWWGLAFLVWAKK